MRLQLTCECCKRPLSGSLDTYGEPGQEMCWECWSALEFDPELVEMGSDYYGLAPHHHDLTITGSFIGSAVFDPLPEPAPDGRYWIEARREWFWPDPEVNGRMGIWSKT